MAVKRKKGWPPALSEGEELFALQLRVERLQFTRQYVICEDRRWRFDFAAPEKKLLLEIHGGIWTAGEHARGRGITRDCEKVSTACILGYRVLLATTEQVKSEQALRWWMMAIEHPQAETALLSARKWKGGVSGRDHQK